MRDAWLITLKDLRLLWRDQRTLAILILLPLIFITILGTTTGQLFALRERAKKVKVGVVNLDPGEMSQKILSEVELLEALEMEEFPDPVSARKKMEQGDFDVTVVIGPQYSARVAELRLGDLKATKGRLKDGLLGLDVVVESSPYFANAKEVLEKLVYGFAYQTFVLEILDNERPTWLLDIKRAAVKIDKEADEAAAHVDSAVNDLKQIAQQSPEIRSPVDSSNYVYQIIVPSYTVMFVFFIIILMARSMIEERDLGTLSRLRMSPVTQSATIIGKTVPFFIVSVVQTLLLFLAGKLFFNMSWGVQPWALLPVIVSTSLAAIGLGLLVATTARTDAQVSAYGNFLVLTMAGISGCLMPRQWQPEIMQKVGLITPHAWSLVAYDQLLTKQYPQLDTVAQSCLMLLAFAVLFFALGWWRFKSLQ